MISNNNQKVIWEMALRSLKKKNSGLIIFTVMLSSFMLFSVLTAGRTYFQMLHVQNIRSMGGDFDAVISNGVNAEQVEQCRKNKDVLSAGLASYSGYSVKTEADSTLHTGLIWCDETNWKQTKPARTKTKGHYPQKENELMATKEALEDCGMAHLDIGDTFVLTYADNNGEHTKEFCISGMWEGYGDKKIFYVSKAFFEQSGYELGSTGLLFIKFKKAFLFPKEKQAFEEELGLTNRQRFIFHAYSEHSLDIFLGIAGLAFITCLSAYLLIYNILYLSVSGRTRYFGLLQTIGMTDDQIRRYFRMQVLLIGIIGIGMGLLIGIGTSIFLLPFVLQTMGISRGIISIHFYPAVFLLCILISGTTLYLGSRKPARTASGISPMEALGYRPVSVGKRISQAGRGRLLWRMAQNQLLNDKKKTGMVIVSLAVSLSVFLCMVTLIKSQGARTIVSNHMDTDFIITNDTLQNEDSSKWSQIMDDSFYQSIQRNPAIQEVHPLLAERIVVPWEPGFAEIWMKTFYETWMDISYEEGRAEYQADPDHFYSLIYGIDETEFDCINSTLETKIDREAFLNGRTCILYGSNMVLNDYKGMPVHFRLQGKESPTYSLTIAGITNDIYYSCVNGGGPNILVSRSYMQQMAGSPYLFKLNIRYAKEFDEEVEKQILTAVTNSSHARDFSYDSKLEEMKEIEKAQGNMMEIAAGIALILALIGILNYVNTISRNIQNRQVTLAIMESVGMTQKQVKGLLVREGLLYAAGSLLLTALLGTGVTYLLYQSMNYNQIPFQLPLVPVFLEVFLVTAVCLLIPLAAYHILSGKGSLIEQIRGMD